MDRTQSLTAGEIINTYEPGQLVRILRTYGEEKFATRIVESIVKQRAIAPMNSTAQLAEMVKGSNSCGNSSHRWQPCKAHIPSTSHRNK